MNTWAFWQPALWGLVGFLGWVVLTWYDPHDDSVGASFKIAGRHTRTILLAFVAYMLVCMSFFEDGSLTPAVAGLSAFSSQAVLATLLDARKARVDEHVGVPDKAADAAKEG